MLPLEKLWSYYKCVRVWVTHIKNESGFSYSHCSHTDAHKPHALYDSSPRLWQFIWQKRSSAPRSPLLVRTSPRLTRDAHWDTSTVTEKEWKNNRKEINLRFFLFLHFYFLLQIGKKTTYTSFSQCDGQWMQSSVIWHFKGSNSFDFFSNIIRHQLTLRTLNQNHGWLCEKWDIHQPRVRRSTGRRAEERSG